MQFVERVPWIRAFNVEYYLGVDGFSMPLILLTTFLTPIVVLAGWEVIQKRTAQYFAAFLILEGLMIGVFSIFIVVSVSVLGQHTTSTFNKVVATWPT